VAVGVAEAEALGDLHAARAELLGELELDGDARAVAGAFFDLAEVGVGEHARVADGRGFAERLLEAAAAGNAAERFTRCTMRCAASSFTARGNAPTSMCVCTSMRGRSLGTNGGRAARGARSAAPSCATTGAWLDGGGAAGLQAARRSAPTRRVRRMRGYGFAGAPSAG